MRKSDLTYILGSVFASATAFFYCCTMWFHIPLPRYYPLEHVWKWANERGVPSQGWYGMQGFAFLAAGLVTLAVYAALRGTKATENPCRPGVLKVLGMLATLLIAVCLYAMLHHEFVRWGIFAPQGS